MADIPEQLLSIVLDGDIAVVTLLNVWLSDEETIDLLGLRLFALVEKDGHRKVILDLANVDYLTSTVLGKLITLHRMLHRRRGQLVLCGISAGINSILRTGKIISYFCITENKQDGLALFLGNASGRNLNLQVTCPIYGCGGIAESRHIVNLGRHPMSRETWSEECPVCGAEFTLSGEWPSNDQTTEASVRSFLLTTYENERIEVLPSNNFYSSGARASLAIVRVIGRLDLYASESLEKAWQSLPMPRWAIFDLQQTSEITEKGLGTLLDLCQADGIKRRAAVLIDRDRASIFGDLSFIFPEDPDGWKVLGEIPNTAGGSMMVQVQRVKNM